MDSKKIRVLYVQPGKYPEERMIDNTLKTMQTLVGGDIEAVYPWRDRACIVCDGESKLKNSPLNRPLEDYDILAGNFFVCGLSGGDFTSLTDEQLKRYEKLYHTPILFMKTRMGFMPMPITPEQYTEVMADIENRNQARREQHNHDER